MRCLLCDLVLYIILYFAVCKSQPPSCSLYSLLDALDHGLSLERAALTTAWLVQELEESSAANVSALTTTTCKKATEDTQRTQFLIKLAPRIRKLEKNVVTSLGQTLESVLKQQVHQDQQDSNKEQHLLMIGHCLRGLALLFKGKEVESIFARVAIM